MRYLSLFSGIEAASVAWAPLGWECVGVAEIEPFPCAVLAHHYPDVPNLGSVTDITDEQIAALGPIDLVVGGSPCQDLSVAGKRKGLAGARSGLFHEQLRIFHAARTLCGARWLLWENVPGAFSSHNGRDFAVVVGEMAGAEFGVPGGKWQNSGAAVGENGLVEWRTLDAQYVRVESHPRAVPQRRRRVFALLDTGDWASRPPVLLEPEGLRGDSPPRREAGEGVAGCLTPGAHPGGFNGQDAYENKLITQAFGGNRTSGPIDVSTSVLAHSGPHGRMDFGSETFIACPIPAPNGWPKAVASCLNAHFGDKQGIENQHIDQGAPLYVPAVAFDTTQVTSKHNYSNPKPGDPCHPLASSAHPPAVAFSCKDHGADAGPIAPTLRSMNFDSSHANGGGQVAVAFGGDVAHSLNARHDSSPCADRGMDVVATAMRVRRLTPRECERLQGFPDDYTLIPFRNKPAADGPRYKALGNSFACNVISWIGMRIQEVING